MKNISGKLKNHVKNNLMPANCYRSGSIYPTISLA